MSDVLYEVRGKTAVLTLNNPPINGISYGVRSGLFEALDRALADTGVTALVITGGSRDFSGGADVREFGTPKSGMAPAISNIIERFESSSKPVVAAIQGNCLGGGLELALGCHWRVAHKDAVLGLPEVKLGLLPGAGGTQRLPRAIDLERALNMIVSGEILPASGFLGTALVDAVTDGPVVEAAIMFAEQALAEGRSLRRLRDERVQAPMSDAFLQFGRNTVKAANRFLPAPMACVEAVAAAVNKRFDEGLKLERTTFISLMNTPESRALRHAFTAERLAGKVEGLRADTPIRDVHSVAVIGAGTMGGGIAMSLAGAGIQVVLLEANQAALDKGLETIRRNYENSVKRGKLSQAYVDQCMERIMPALSYDALSQVDLVIEAVFESMEVKAEVFSRLDAVCKPGAILASNTSALDLNKIACFTKRPQDVIGLHFFSPANQMRLLEIVRGAATADDVLATSMALARRLKKVGVVAGVCDGFIGNRMLARYGAATSNLIDIGALPQQVDRALESFGFAMGVFRVSDMAGLDIGWATRKRRAAADPARDYANVADRLCEAGRFGQKTGAGWYRYEPSNRNAIPDPEVTRIIEEWRKERSYATRKITDQEIVERCVFALVNEGARILVDGIAQRASDIDAVYLNGYGFPRFRGGPMKYADEVGLPNVVRALQRIAQESPQDAEFWTPAPLLVELANQGRTFNFE